MNIKRSIACSIFVVWGAWIIGCGSDDSSSTTNQGTPDANVSNPSNVDAGSQNVTGVDSKVTSSIDGAAAAKTDSSTSTGLKDAGSGAPKTPGTVCTQTDKNCGIGMRCIFAQDLNAAKGTCSKECNGTWNDPVCKENVSTSYVMQCWQRSETINNQTTNFNICVFTCTAGNNSTCPPAHNCVKNTSDDSYLCIPQQS